LKQDTPQPSIIHLTWWMYAYRVPLLDQLYARLGSKFLVITHKTQVTRSNQTALSAGKFPRLLLSGKHIELNRSLFHGQGTPLGFTVTPGLLFALLRIRPRMVISITFNTWTLLCLLMGFPTAIFWEGTHHTERASKRWRIILRRWMVRRAKAFIVNGISAKRYLVEELGAKPEDIFVGGQSPLPPPEDVYNANHINKPKGKSVRFLFVGQLIPRKGCQHLIESAAVLAKKGYTAFELLIVGEGAEQELLKARVRQTGLDGHTKFLGAVSPEEVWNYYAKSDVFVLPTLTDNWPLVAVEAMHVGKPILLSKFAGSSADLIEEASNGFTFDPYDHSQLAAFMEFYLKNPLAIREHGARSLTIAQAYRPERVADVYMAALRHVGSKIPGSITL
jgi:glycosyltransferase involved in cell wall biosynthesis